MPLKRRIPVAKTGEIPDGQTKSFQFGPFKGIAIRKNGKLIAFVNRCTHMGGPVEMHASGNKLRCRWHGADFHPETGEAIEGQAPQGTALQRIELIEQDGTVFALLELPDDPFG
ncbi:Rieske (2Fe-2S) protein [Candidatus Uhrbacteria bacterium]|nr:Rieske (2Fe-2S) protein [Candidatus Uhrbacteria bacterium]